MVVVNDGFEYRERIGAEADGRSLVEYLASTYRHSSAEVWCTRVGRGEVSLDRTTAHVSSMLRQGQTLSWRRPGWKEPAAPCAFAVLYRDDDLLAVAKPAGLPVLPGAGYLRSTLLALVREHDPQASPLHRLGRGTSGVVLCARSAMARGELSRQWADRTVYKRYRTLAGGRPGRERFSIDVPIGPVPHERLGSVHAANPDGKPASTHVIVREQRRASFLADVTIETGRPHQIRIHLAAAGHPLVGDPLYPSGGVPEPGARAVPGDAGYLLHAAKLAFVHPRTGRRISVCCAPPPALRASS